MKLGLNMTKKKVHKKIILICVLIGASIILSFIMGAIINSMLINDMKVNLTRSVLGHKDTYMIMLLIFLLIWFAMFVICT